MSFHVGVGSWIGSAGWDLFTLTKRVSPVFVSWKRGFGVVMPCVLEPYKPCCMILAHQCPAFWSGTTDATNLFAPFDQIRSNQIRMKFCIDTYLIAIDWFKLHRCNFREPFTAFNQRWTVQASIQWQSPFVVRISNQINTWTGNHNNPKRRQGSSELNCFSWLFGRQSRNGNSAFWLMYLSLLTWIDCFRPSEVGARLLVRSGYLDGNGKKISFVVVKLRAPQTGDRI